MRFEAYSSSALSFIQTLRLLIRVCLGFRLMTKSSKSLNGYVVGLGLELKAICLF